MLGVFKELSCEAAGHRTVLTLRRERHWLKAGTVQRKVSDKSVSHALQNIAQFLDLLQRENKGEVRDLTILNSLLGKCMYDLLEASPWTVGDWSFFSNRMSLLKEFEYGD